MYKLEQEYLIYKEINGENTDEYIISKLRDITYRTFRLDPAGVRITLEINNNGNGYGYILGHMVTFEERYKDHLIFKVWTEV